MHVYRSTQYRRLLLAGLALLGLTAAGCGQSGTPWSAPASGALRASGVVQTEQINIASELGGRVVAVPVAEGETVTAGQTIVQLDTALLDAQIAAGEALVAAAQAGLALAQAGARPGQIAVAEAQLRQAQAGRDAAAQALADLEALIAEPQEINLQIAVREAQLVAEQHRLAEAVARKDAAEHGMHESDAYRSELGAAKDTLGRIPGAGRTGLGSVGESIDLSRLLLELSYIPYWQGWVGVNAQAESIEGLRAILANLYEQKENPQELLARRDQARAGLAQAEALLAAAQAQLQALQAGASPEQIAALEARLAQAEAGLQALQEQRRMLEIRAPAAGTVLEIVTRPAEVAAAGATLLTLAGNGEVGLTVYVPETQIGQVHLGQAVEVRIDSFPGRAFAGRVSRIADRAQFTPRNVSTREERVNLVFAVEIRIANEDGALKPGMPADVLFAAGAAEGGAAKEAPRGPIAGALRGDVEPLQASGTVRAHEVRLAAELGGRIAAVHAQAGDAVQAGDVLVELDQTPWLLQLAQAEAALNTARADLATATAGPRPEEIAAMRAALAQAEAERDGALAAWQSARAALENPQQLDVQLAEARTQVALAAQAVEKAKADMWGVHRLRDANDPNGPGFLVTAADEAYAAALADEKAAQALLEHLEGIRERPLGFIAQAHAAEGQYRVAEAAVAVAQARLDDLLAGPRPEQVAVAEAAVAQAEAQLRVVQVQLAKATLQSPINGVVLHQELRAGEVAAPAATILTLADLSEVSLDVYVPENRIGWVRLGQAVQVTVDSFPGRTFAGRVSRIGDEPEYTPQNVATAEGRLNTFYVVEIRLPNPEGLLKPGMPADALFGQ